ncbi:hypothetical protein VIGAN_01398900, partial [Vigna angularis var. angularis]
TSVDVYFPHWLMLWTFLDIPSHHGGNTPSHHDGNESFQTKKNWKEKEMEVREVKRKWEKGKRVAWVSAEKIKLGFQII